MSAQAAPGPPHEATRLARQRHPVGQVAVLPGLIDPVVEPMHQFPVDLGIPADIGVVTARNVAACLSPPAQTLLQFEIVHRLRFPRPALRRCPRP